MTDEATFERIQKLAEQWAVDLEELPADHPNREALSQQVGMMFITLLFRKMSMNLADMMTVDKQYETGWKDAIAALGFACNRFTLACEITTEEQAKRLDRHIEAFRNGN